MTIRRVLVVGHPFDDPVRMVEAMAGGAHHVSTDWVAEPEGMHGQHYDLVIADYGRAVQALAAFEHAAVIVVSDRAGEDLAVQMMRLGAADYLLTSRLDQLGPAIDRALGAVQRRRAHPTRDDLARLLLVHSIDLVVSVDADGRLLVVNDAVRAVLGYHPEELVGQAFSTFLHADDVDRAWASFRAARDGELVGNVECRCLHRSGEVRHAIWSVVVTEAGVVTAIGHDITARKRAEERVLQERDYADAIINSLPGIFFHYDDGMRLLRWNRTVAQTTGYSDDDLVTMHPRSSSPRPIAGWPPMRSPRSSGPARRAVRCATSSKTGRTSRTCSTPCDSTTTAGPASSAWESISANENVWKRNCARREHFSRRWCRTPRTGSWSSTATTAESSGINGSRTCGRFRPASLTVPTPNVCSTSSAAAPKNRTRSTVRCGG
ncbi:hypothetical protein B1R94_03175 [Mycolicibacterium litorale]|nr:hypothetical protein B1R94_03175 [Mycolicibacterium litorale]